MSFIHRRNTVTDLNWQQHSEPVERQNWQKLLIKERCSNVRYGKSPCAHSYLGVEREILQESYPRTKHNGPIRPQHCTFRFSMLTVTPLSLQELHTHSIDNWSLTLTGTACFVNARDRSNWWMQWIGRNPVSSELSCGVTGTVTAWAVTTYHNMGHSM